MPGRAVLLSDLHLTSNPALDDFRRDEDLAALVDLPLLQPGDDPVDLVLLGDTFGLWQSISETGCKSRDGSDVPLDYDGVSEAKRSRPFFADDPEMEQFFRAAYRDSEEVREAVNEILDARISGETVPSARCAPGGDRSRARSEVPLPDRGGPPADRAPTRRGDHPADELWADRLFTGKPYFRPRLSFPAVRFVVFGHTHDALRRELSSGAVYLNSGSWTSGRGTAAAYRRRALGRRADGAVGSAHGRRPARRGDALRTRGAARRALMRLIAGGCSQEGAST